MSALFCIPVSLVVRAVIRMSDLVWFAVLGAMTLLVSYTIHERVKSDWRARDTMNFHDADRRSSVARNIRIGRR